MAAIYDKKTSRFEDLKTIREVFASHSLQNLFE